MGSFGFKTQKLGEKPLSLSTTINHYLAPNFDGLKNIISLQPQKESENKNIPSFE